ncbi:4-hydroxybenzoate polyprenyltransferase, mitochondrial [Aspergillus udagawae]|nr:4-hydroxybenzoate polyprenyltransferase, mitochondrial [Aspergillus udagawae]
MDSVKRKKSKSQGKEPALNNYSGNQVPTAGLLSRLPLSWVPYIQLARLSPPAGLFLIYFPHVFGLMHAALHLSTPVPDILRAGAVLFGGSFFVSNAIHIWNDLIDAPLDALVSRTKHRPIPRGAVSPTAALIYTITQAIAAALFLSLLPHSQSWFYALPSILGWTYYPWAKRHTNYPQVVLGLCLAWGVVMGELSLGIETISFPQGWSWKKLIHGEFHVNSAILSLVFANTLWTVIYDTVYAHQDIEDDLKAGIKSIAVLWRQQTKILLWGSLVMLALLLSYCGYASNLGFFYYFIAVIGATGSLGRMILQVDLKDEQSCWWWFRNGFWLAGGAITAGFSAEYLKQIIY